MVRTRASGVQKKQARITLSSSSSVLPDVPTTWADLHGEREHRRRSEELPTKGADVLPAVVNQPPDKADRRSVKARASILRKFDLITCECGHTSFGGGTFCTKCGKNNRQFICICGAPLDDENGNCPKCSEDYDKLDVFGCGTSLGKLLGDSQNWKITTEEQSASRRSNTLWSFAKEVSNRENINEETQSASPGGSDVSLVERPPEEPQFVREEPKKKHRSGEKKGVNFVTESDGPNRRKGKHEETKETKAAPSEHPTENDGGSERSITVHDDGHISRTGRCHQSEMENGADEQGKKKNKVLVIVEDPFEESDEDDAKDSRDADLTALLTGDGLLDDEDSEENESCEAQDFAREYSSERQISRIEVRATLPKQLSKSIQAVLLVDLIEHNGIGYRLVKPDYFSEKYVGLYFAKLDNIRCDAFAATIKKYRAMHLENLAIVLISCDNNHDSFSLHTHALPWPTYPHGDYRAPILRNYFGIEDCPRLIILDPNGMVITDKGVEKLENGDDAFPPVEQDVDTLWGDHLHGNVRLLVDDLNLPMCNGLSYKDYEVVALLFGEPWCPETRRLARRLSFLIEEVLKRQRSRDSTIKDVCCPYLIHSDDLVLHRLFPDFNDLSFPSLRISKGHRLEAILHFLEVESTPALCFISPKVGWVVQDGAGWLQRDPTGVCFPWLPQDVVVPDEIAQSKEGFAQPFYDIVKELHENEINDALCNGPIFVALLQGVGSQRTESLSLVRAVATAYAARVADRCRDMSNRPIELHKDYCSQDTENELERLQSSTSVPSTSLSLPEIDGAIRLEKKLYSVTRQSLFHHGSAPWNTKGESLREQRSGLSFYFLCAETRAVQVLCKFCCHDIRTLHQHELWSAQQSRRDNEAHRTRTELQERAQQLWQRNENHQGKLSGNSKMDFLGVKSVATIDRPIGRQLTKHENEKKHRRTSQESQSQRGSQRSSFGAEGESVLPSLQFSRQNTADSSPTNSTNTANDLTVLELSVPLPPKIDKPKLRRGTMDTRLILQSAAASLNVVGPGAFRTESHGGDSDEDEINDLTTTSHFPRTQYHPPNELTEHLLGEGHRNNGTALIIDLAKGAYYVLSSLTNKESLFQFIDGWYDGVLEPFDISLKNTNEMVVDQERMMQGQITHSIPDRITPVMHDHRPRIMPCIVIWLPSGKHARNPLGAPGLHRAFLNYAFRQAPREDTHAATSNGVIADTKDLNDILGVFGKAHARLVPVIEKFWIFALEDCPEALSESHEGIEGLQYDPPGKEFLSELEKLFRHLLRKVAKAAFTSGKPETTKGLEELRKGAGRRGGHASGSSSTCFRIEKTRRALHAALLDELTYHLIVQCPPPPLFMMLVGDLPAASALPWPESLSAANFHVLGNIPDLRTYQDTITPSMTVMDWERWVRNTADDKISMSVARHILVPWTAHTGP